MIQAVWPNHLLQTRECPGKLQVDKLLEILRLLLLGLPHLILILPPHIIAPPVLHLKQIENDVSRVVSPQKAQTQRCYAHCLSGSAPHQPPAKTEKQSTWKSNKATLLPPENKLQHGNKWLDKRSGKTRVKRASARQGFETIGSRPHREGYRAMAVSNYDIIMIFWTQQTLQGLPDLPG